MLRLTSLLATAALAATASAQFSLVIPNGMAAAEGSSSNAFPWGRGGTGIRIQTVYDSSHFTSQGVTFPVLITRLRWRPNTNASSLASNYATGATVQLSTCPVDQAAVTTNMAGNQGADLTTVFSGPVSWPAAAATPGPCPFLIDVPFTQNFLYDPNAGDLNIETDIPIQTFTGTALQLDVHTTAPLASRTYVTTGYVNGGPNNTGVIGLNHGVVVEVSYVPAAGLYAGFTANVTTGPSPLAVNFTDQTFTSDPNGITSWAWDFDGDSVIDSTVQNPTFVYTTCGTYNVSLTVTDGTHAPNTLTRTAYVSTDQVVGNFTATVVGPLTVQFTDTSTGPATAWAWDLDGDNIVDSTVQNPVWVYASASPVNVTLTASRLCRTAAPVTKSVVAVQQFSHNVVPNNGLSTGASVYFDLDVLNPLGMSIGAMDVFGSVVNVPFTVDMYVKHGTHRGFEGTAAEWTLVNTASGTSASATTLPSLVTFPQAQYLPPGLYGVKLLYNGTGPRYQNLTVTTTVGNADLNLTLGVSRGTTVALPWSGSNVDLRGWSGTLYYSTSNVGNLAGFGAFGPGCAGSRPVSKATGNRPQLGNVHTVTFNNLPQSLGILITGFSRSSSVFGPLPLGLGAFGAPGCFGRVSSDVTTFVVGAGNSASWSLNVPNAGGLIGLALYNQMLVFDPGFNALGAVMSDAVASQVGN
jgi:PKD repeat protein